MKSIQNGLPVLIFALLVLSTGARAQTWEYKYADKLFLSSAASDETKKLTILAPTLGSSATITFPGATLTFPASNAGGLLANGGTGTLSWVTTSTANQILLSGSSVAPIWSTATYPGTAGAAGNYLRSNGTNFLSSAIQASDLAAISGAAGSVAVLKRNSSNLTTSSTTLVNATGLSFSIAANEIWSLDFELSCNAASAGGMAFGITIPSGATIEANSMGVRASVNNYQCDRITSSGSPTLVQYAKANDGPVRITGLVVNGSTAGTVQLQFLSGSSGSSVTIYANSYGLANRW